MTDNNLPAERPTEEVVKGNSLLLPIKKLIALAVETIVNHLDRHTEAIERLAASQAIQNDRLAAMERQARLNTLVTPKQVRYFNEAIRERAQELLLKRGSTGDKKAITALSSVIRRAVLKRYGAAALHEIPRHEYAVVLSQVNTWNDALLVRDVLKKLNN